MIGWISRSSGSEAAIGLGTLVFVGLFAASPIAFTTSTNTPKSGKEKSRLSSKNGCKRLWANEHQPIAQA
jgi:hypothetical protein